MDDQSMVFLFSGVPCKAAFYIKSLHGTNPCNHVKFSSPYGIWLATFAQLLGYCKHYLLYHYVPVLDFLSYKLAGN